MDRWQSWWLFLDRHLSRTIFHPQYFLKKGERLAVRKAQKRASGVFLDVGAGRQWYRPQIEPLVDKYLALEQPKMLKYYASQFPIEIKSQATKIPLADFEVGTALMLWVLEHLEDPGRVLAEVRRVLKKDGRLIICTPINYPTHGFPPNYQRWNRIGLEKFLGEFGFVIESAESFGNYWEVMTVLVNVFLMMKVKKAVGGGVVRAVSALVELVLFAPIVVFGNVVALGMGRGRTQDEFALGEVVVAKKTNIRK